MCLEIFSLSLKTETQKHPFSFFLENSCFQELLVSGTPMNWLISGSSQVHLVLSNAGENPEGLGGRRPGFLAECDLHLTVGSWASQPLSGWVFICEVRLQTQRRCPHPPTHTTACLRDQPLPYMGCIDKAHDSREGVPDTDGQQGAFISPQSASSEPLSATLHLRLAFLI